MNASRNRSTLSLLACLAAMGGGCTAGTDSPGPVSVTDSAGVQILQLGEGAFDRGGRLALSPHPDLTIGAREGSDDQLLYRVSGGLVLGDGRIAILDGGSRELRYYDSNGVLGAHQGGRGEGPGEYGEPAGLWSLPGDTVVVWDPRLMRLTVVGPDASVVREVPVSGPTMVAEAVGGFSDGSFVIARPEAEDEQTSTGQQVNRSYSRYSPLGDSVNALGVFSWRRMGRPPMEMEASGGMRLIVVTPLVFDAPTEVATASSGIWVGTTREDELLQIDESGNLERIVRWVGPDRTVTDAVKEAYYEDLRERMAENAPEGEAREPPELPFADRFPSHGTLVARTDGGCWMKDFIRPGMDPSNRWRILGPAGLPEGFIDLPLSADVLWVSPDRVLLVERDELDVEYVRLYTLTSETDAN
jgi:hypothetical protein